MVGISIHLSLFKHVKLFNFPGSPNQYSHYQEKLSRRPLGPGVLALPEDHPQRYQAKQPSQVFSILGLCWLSQLHQACQNDYYWRWMEVAPTSYSAAKNADKIF